MACLSGPDFWRLTLCNKFLNSSCKNTVEKESFKQTRVNSAKHFECCCGHPNAGHVRSMRYSSFYSGVVLNGVPSRGPGVCECPYQKKLTTWGLDWGPLFLETPKRGDLGALGTAPATFQHAAVLHCADNGP